MADLLRAQDLPVGTTVRDGEIVLTKTDTDEWRPPAARVWEWACDRQVDILLDTTATVVLPEQASN